MDKNTNQYCLPWNGLIFTASNSFFFFFLALFCMSQHRNSAQAPPRNFTLVRGLPAGAVGYLRRQFGVKYLGCTEASQMGFAPSGHKSALLNMPANWANSHITHTYYITQCGFFYLFIYFFNPHRVIKISLIMRGKKVCKWRKGKVNFICLVFWCSFLFYFYYLFFCGA